MYIKICISCLVLFGWALPTHAQTRDDQSGLKVRPQCCVVFIDGTGSYKYLDRGKKVAISLLNSLPPESKVFVRWITEDSYSDKASIISLLLPPVPSAPSALNQRAKDAYSDFIARRQRFYSKAAATINTAVSPHAMKTDIWGALYAASERFDSNPNLEPLLVLMTDMDDNVGRSFDAFSLKGVKTEIMAYQVDPHVKGNSRKKQWGGILKQLGVSSVEFKHMDEILAF